MDVFVTSFGESDLETGQIAIANDAQFTLLLADTIQSL